MKKQIVMAVLGMFSAAALFAAEDARSEVKAAAKKLGEAANYSWTATPKFEGGPGGGGGGGFRPGATEGQAEKGGLIYTKSTMGERIFEAAMKGEKIIAKTEEGWQSADELEGNRGAFMARRMRSFKAPAVEAAELADKATGLKKADGVITGTLTEGAAKEMLSFGGRRPGGDTQRPEPKEAKGTVKFWVQNGELTRYEYNVQGKVMGREDNEIPINRTTTVELKNVGKTRLELPEEAKKKLS
jgi:hypothetical protein